MTKLAPPNVPFVQAHHHGGKQRPTAIVIRSSFTPSVRGAALAIANYWHQPNSPIDSCHYVVDESNVYRCVPDKVSAYSLPASSRGSISINVCSEPLENVHFWDDAEHVATLDLVADLVAELTRVYKIAPKYLNSEEEARWMKTKRRRHGGIIVRVEGAWPYSGFIANVEARVQKLQAS